MKSIELIKISDEAQIGAAYEKAIAMQLHFAALIENMLWKVYLNPHEKCRLVCYAEPKIFAEGYICQIDFFETMAEAIKHYKGQSFSCYGPMPLIDTTRPALENPLVETFPRTTLDDQE